MSELSAEHIDKELLPFLSRNARGDIRGTTLEYFLGLTGSDEGRSFIVSNQKYLSAIVSLLEDDIPAIAKDAHLALVNLSTDSKTSWTLLNLDLHPDLDEKLLQYVLNRESEHANIACSILSNLSISEQCAEKLVDLMITKKDIVGFDKIVFAFCHADYNAKNNLHYLGPFLSNLTQIRTAREYIMDKDKYVIQRLLPFVEYKDSKLRRGGIIGALRNCCFETGKFMQITIYI